MIVGEETLTIDTGSMMLSEADDCERLTGWTVNEWDKALMDNRANAVRFAYWLGRKRAGNPVEGDFADIEFDLGIVDWKVELPEPAEDDGPRPTGKPPEVNG